MTGEMEIGGKSVDDLIAEVDAGIPSYERMLVFFKNKAAAEVMAWLKLTPKPGSPRRKPHPKDSSRIDAGRLSVKALKW